MLVYKVMMADLNGSNGLGGSESVAMPPNVSDFTQDLDFGMADIDFSFMETGFTRTVPPVDQGNAIGGSESSTTPHSDVQQRSEAFKRSPWSWNHWIPDRNDYAFSGQEKLDVPHTRVDTDGQSLPSTILRPFADRHLQTN